MERFGLEEASRARMDDLGVSKPWQAYVQVRLAIFEDLIDDPEVLRDEPLAAHHRAARDRPLEVPAGGARHHLRDGGGPGPSSKRSASRTTST